MTPLLQPQQSADEVEGDLLGGAGEEALGEAWEALEGRGGYGSGFEKGKRDLTSRKMSEGCKDKCRATFTTKGSHTGSTRKTHQTIL